MQRGIALAAERTARRASTGAARQHPVLATSAVWAHTSPTMWAHAVHLYIVNGGSCGAKWPARRFMQRFTPRSPPAVSWWRSGVTASLLCCCVCCRLALCRRRRRRPPPPPRSLRRRRLREATIPRPPPRRWSSASARLFRTSKASTTVSSGIVEPAAGRAALERRRRRRVGGGMGGARRRRLRAPNQFLIPDLQNVYAPLRPRPCPRSPPQPLLYALMWLTRSRVQFASSFAISWSNTFAIAALDSPTWVSARRHE